MIQLPRLLALACSVLLFGSLQAQEFLFSAATPDTIYGSRTRVLECANTDLVQVAEAASAQFNEHYLFFRRFTAEGELLLSTRLAITDEFPLSICGLVELTDGSFLVAGNYPVQAMLIKLNAQGELLWARRTTVQGALFASLHRLNDSTVVGLGQNNLGELMICRINEQGELISTSSYTVDDHGADALFLIPSVNGGFWIGAEGADADGQNSSSSFRICLLRCNATGEVLWAKRYLLPGSLLPLKGVVELSDGSVLAAATRLIPGTGSWPFLLKVDPQGEVLFAKEYKAAADTTGYFSAQGLMGPFNEETWFLGYGLGGPTMMRMDASGNSAGFAISGAFVWAEAGPITSSGDGLVPFSTHGFLGATAFGLLRGAADMEWPCAAEHALLTYSRSVEVGEGFIPTTTDLPMADISDLFTSLPSVLTEFDACLFTSATDQVHKAHTITIRPNPAHDRISIDGDRLQWLELLDGMGRKLFARSTNAASDQLDLQHLGPGIYHLRVLQADHWSVHPLMKE